MPFNANTYRANRDRKAALAWLARAREIKSRVEGGIYYAWEPDQIRGYAQYARWSWRSYLFWREQRQHEIAMREFQRRLP